MREGNAVPPVPLRVSGPAATVLVLTAVVASAAPRPEEGPPAPAGAASPEGASFWRAEELALIDRGLEVLNATRADLGFQKRPIDDPFRLAVVDRALDDPLSLGREAGAWEAAARTGDPRRMLLQAAGALELPDVPPLPPDAPPTGLPESADLPAGIRDAVDALVHEIARHRPHRIVDPLDPTSEPSAAVLRKALLSQVEHPRLPPVAPDMTDDAFLAAARGLRAAGTAAAADRLLGAVAAVVRRAAERGADDGARWEGMRRYATDAGTVVVYGHGDDVHDRDADAAAVLVIDLAGDDTWHRGASASVFEDRRVSVCIDLGGDDRHVGREDFACGGALGGVAIHWDASGNDLYDAGHASLGAGIAGAGILVDGGGDDVYRCGDFGLGAGAFGIGILLDGGGNDIYRGDLYAQGFASTRGCGVLADLDGHDLYDAGGRKVHAPLYADRHQSLSQGFSIGMRPDASGGVGVLVDLRGNDRYTADIYGQGSSYWYALGILVDGDGNDTYNLGQYGQGAGIHLSAGILVDHAGSDLYYLKNGVGMGGAHDYAVGILVDRGGDDTYAGSGGTQGGALTNSVAILLDAGGNDGYAAVNPGGAQGGASVARGTGGIGLLLDAAGADVYSETARDGLVWTKELLGAGLDEPGATGTGGSGDPGATTMSEEAARAEVDRDGRVTGPDGVPADDLDRLWAVASRWEVGDQRVVVPVARERLVALGPAALARAVDRVGTKDGLEFRAVEAVLARFPAEEVVPLVVARSRDGDVAVRRGAVRALGTLRAAAAIPRLEEMLADDAPTRAAVLAALTALGTAPPAVRGLLRAQEERVAVAAATCLAAAGGPAAVDALAAALGPDHAFPVRLAALDRLAAAGEAAVDRLSRVAGDGTAPPMARRNALRALGRTRSAAAIPALAAALESPDRLLRLSAYQAARELVEGIPPEAGTALAAALASARAAERDALLRRAR